MMHGPIYIRCQVHVYWNFYLTMVTLIEICRKPYIIEYIIVFWRNDVLVSTTTQRNGSYQKQILYHYLANECTCVGGKYCLHHHAVCWSRTLVRATGWHCFIKQKPKYEFLCSKGTRVVSLESQTLPWARKIKFSFQTLLLENSSIYT